MSIATSNLIELAEAAVRSGYGLSTLRRHIKMGDLAAVKIKGRLFVASDDLDTFAAPQPVGVSDASLEDWVERMVAKAPPFRPEQRTLIISVFATALGGE